MRITTISSSIATVVSRVMNIVAAAGTVRHFPSLMRLRERLGFWLEPCQARLCGNGGYLGHHFAYAKDMQPGKPGPACKPWPAEIALAQFSADARLSSARVQRSTAQSG